MGETKGRPLLVNAGAVRLAVLVRPMHRFGEHDQRPVQVDNDWDVVPFVAVKQVVYWSVGRFLSSHASAHAVIRERIVCIEAHGNWCTWWH